jgi:hypothetical protein
VETTVEEATVRCSLEHRADLGDLLAALARSTRRDIRRVREVPMPLRDLIAHVYSQHPSEESRAS